MSTSSVGQKQATIIIVLYGIGFIALLWGIPFTIDGVIATAQAILTIEGIIVGLTSIIERVRRRVLPFLIGIVGLFISMITLMVAEAGKYNNFGGMLSWYLLGIDGEFLVAVLVAYFVTAIQP